MADRRDTAVADESSAQQDAGSIESYEVDGAVVLHDAENPFAWVEADADGAIDLADRT